MASPPPLDTGFKEEHEDSSQEHPSSRSHLQQLPSSEMQAAQHVQLPTSPLQTHATASDGTRIDLDIDYPTSILDPDKIAIPSTETDKPRLEHYLERAVAEHSELRASEVNMAIAMLNDKPPPPAPYRDIRAILDDHEAGILFSWSQRAPSVCQNDSNCKQVHDKVGNGTKACSFWVAGRIAGETMMPNLSWGKGDVEEAEIWKDMCRIAEENAIIKPGRLSRQRGQNPGSLKALNKTFSIDPHLEESLKLDRNLHKMRSSGADYPYGHPRLRQTPSAQPSTSFLSIPTGRGGSQSPFLSRQTTQSSPITRTVYDPEMKYPGPTTPVVRWAQPNDPLRPYRPSTPSSSGYIRNNNGSPGVHSQLPLSSSREAIVGTRNQHHNPTISQYPPNHFPHQPRSDFAQVQQHTARLALATHITPPPGPPEGKPQVED